MRFSDTKDMLRCVLIHVRDYFRQISLLSSRIWAKQYFCLHTILQSQHSCTSSDMYNIFCFGMSG